MNVLVRFSGSILDPLGTLWTLVPSPREDPRATVNDFRIKEYGAHLF